MKIPIPKVKEKPLIGPDPIKNRIIAANKVVIFASSIAVFDLVYPLSKAIKLFFSFFNSSLILSNIKTFASYEEGDELFSDRNVFPKGCIVKMEKINL